MNPDSQKKGPFVRLNQPFVCHPRSHNRPFIGKKSPLVGTDRSNGFTLMELMVTLVIAVLLGMLAVPSITQFIQSNRLVSTTNELVAAFNAARTEAVKRGTQAIVCESTSGTSCSATGNWNSGWIVFADADNSSTWTASDTMVRVYPAVPPNHATNVSASIVVFDRQGGIQTPATASSSYSVCNSKIGRRKTVVITRIGKVALTENTC
jgi:type IV fimbrial biogenesis protein FimT